jgi:hypothetical protein
MKKFSNLDSTEYLYFAYTAFIVLLFFTNDIFLGHNIFLYAIVPIALWPFVEDQTGIKLPVFPNISVSLLNMSKTLASMKSPIFVASTVYIIFVSISTILIPEFSWSWVHALVYFSIPLMFFILITARISIAIDRFYIRFFRIIIPAAAVVAAINTLHYIYLLPDMLDFPSIRMISFLGRAADHSENASGLFYGVFFTASVIILTEKTDRIFAVVIKLCMPVLFIAMLLTQSRSSLIGSFASLAIFGLIEERSRKYIFFIISLFSIIFFSIRDISGPAIARADNQRIEIWFKFFELAKERFLLGYGERLNFAVDVDSGEIITQAHNILLNAQIFGGIFAFSSLLIAIIYAAWCAYLYLRMKKEGLPFVILMTTVIAGLVDFKIEILTAGWHWVVFWLPIGLSIGTDRSLLISSNNR